MFSVVINVYLDHLKLCVVCINGRMYVCCSECNVVYNECDIANPYVCSYRTWICHDITLFYEEHEAIQRVRITGFPKTANLSPTRGFDTICTAVCNRLDSSTACRLCRLQSASTLFLKQSKFDVLKWLLNLFPSHGAA